MKIKDKKNREQLAKGLGWLSLSVGLAEVLAPRTVSHLIGIKPRPRMMRLLGFREIACGVGILTQPNTRSWLQRRVTGDAMDLGLLSAASLTKRPHDKRLAWATAAVATVTALDVLASQSFENGKSLPATLHFRKSIIVNRPPEQLYAMWRNFEDLPRFMTHLISVQADGAKRSHWIAKGPAGTKVEWDAELLEDRPNEFISWHSLGNTQVDHAGSVRFERARGGRGTVVRVEMDYRPLGGRIGATVAELFGESPEKQISVDLLHFKQFAETGEVAKTEGQPAGRAHSTSRKFDDLLRE